MHNVPSIPLRPSGNAERYPVEQARTLIAELRPLLERAEAAGLPVVAYCLTTAMAKAEEAIKDQEAKR